MTFSYAAAIESTLVQLSAISVPPLSAAYPPKDGMTSPPRERMVEMSAPNTDDEIGWLVEPFQYGVQEPLASACTNAIVRYLAPDFCARSAGLSEEYASKYGAKTWAGSGVAACAAPLPPMTRPADAATVPIVASRARTDLGRLIGALRRGERTVRTPHDWSGPTTR